MESLNAMFRRILPLIFLSLLLCPLAFSFSGYAKKPKIVAAHYAPWFRGPVEGSWTFQLGKKNIKTAYKPLLGYYNSLNRSVLSKHIEWATKYGINTFMIEWPGEDKPDWYSVPDEAMKVFIQNPDFNKIDFFFVYSFLSGLQKNGEPPLARVNLNDNKRINKLLSDFRYASRTYFKRSNYLRIAGRPVIYLWAVTLTNGNLKKTVNKIRNTVKAETGKDPYIIADTVLMYTDPKPSLVKIFDAAMPYAMLKYQGRPPKSYALKESISTVSSRYRYFAYALEDLGVDFIPTVFPGFDATGAPWCYDSNKRLKTPKVKRSASGFKEFIIKAKSYVDPDISMLYITSWSEWNEGTNIEPSQQFKFKYLDALRKGLAKQPAFKAPPYKITFRFKRIVNPGNNDDRQLAVAFDTIDFVDANLKPLGSLDIGSIAAGDTLGWGWYGRESEGSDGPNFVWAGSKQKFATIRTDIPGGTKYLMLKIKQVENQVTKVFLDWKWLADIPSELPYHWTVHLVPLW
jgi:hypothetical protein